MGTNGFKGSAGSLRRKLRGIAALIKDRSATENERANAEALKARLEQQLREAGVPAGDWTDNAFRLGRWAKEVRESASPASPRGDWTDHARGLGKMLRRGY